MKAERSEVRQSGEPGSVTCSASLAGCRRRSGRSSAFRLALAISSFSAIAPWALSAQLDAPPVEQKQKQEDLSRRLIRKAMSQADEDLMDGIIRMMNDAQRKLEVEFDSGEETRALQARIAEKLDEAIKAAAHQRRPRRRSPSAAHPDKRKMPTAGKRDKGKIERGDGGADGSSPAGTAAGTDATEADSLHGELHEMRRGWGHLPSRERDEIVQGIGEGYLDRYRVWIEQYYRALQESDQ